jgi:acetolactate synthase-1/2/3 large subunit
MKTSDYIARRIKQEVDTVFGVTGGCIINVVNSFALEKMNVVSMHHEQAAAIAADAYARYKGFGVCYGTSGPGTTNLLTGTCCSHYDSIPVLTLGGQVPSKFLSGKDRQMGFQEVPGVELFKPVTKFSTRYTNPHDLEKSINEAKKPRCGPTFLEISDDIQRLAIDEPRKETEFVFDSNPSVLNLNEMFPIISKFKKPLLIVGYGAVQSELQIEMPFLYTWRTKDKFFQHNFCKGGLGITEGGPGNKLLKEADLIIMLGTRMDTHMVPDWSKFAPQAYKISVGLDFPHAVNCHVEKELGTNLRVKVKGDDWCNTISSGYLADGPAYRLVDLLSSKAKEGDIIIPDMGQIGCIVFQRWGLKDGQSLFNGINHSPMGYSIPASIGACLATQRRVIVIVGDGSLMMNLHTLQTIVDYKLPVNVFVVNNGGYGMIRQTQNDWKEFLIQGVGCNLPIPNIKKMADAFGMKYSEELSDEPSIFEMKMEETKIIPKWKMGEEL